MQPRRDAIGRRPDLFVANDGAVKRRLIGTVPKSIQAVMPPAGGSFWMPQRISASLRPCRTTSKVGGVSKVGHRASVVPTVPIESPYQAAAGIVPLDLGLPRQQACALDRRPSNSSDALDDIRKPLGAAPHDGVTLRGLTVRHGNLGQT